MSQSAAKKLLPKLKYKLQERRRLRNPEGSQGRHNKIRKTVTALFKYERLEMSYSIADESRGYAERLIADAIRYGDCHQPTMEMAKYWVLEEQVIHKLFKVLVPRYENFGLSYTKIWRGPNIYPGHGYPKCIVELRNNIFPPLGEDKTHNKNLIHNVLLDAAKKAFRSKKETENVINSNVTDTAADQTDNENAGNQLDAKENTLNCEAAADSYSESNKMTQTEQSEENIGIESANETLIEKEKEGTVSGLEDISKIDISKENNQESPSEGEKK